MKKTILLLLAFVAMGLSNVRAYDFSAVAPSGQTLYYNIVGGSAEVTFPNGDANHDIGRVWEGYTMPTGNLTIPSSVTYGGATYPVTSIGNGAFSWCF